MIYEQFRDNLANYKENKKELDNLKQLYDYHFYLLRGVKSPNLTKVFGNVNETLANEMKLDKIEKLNEIKQEIDYLKMNLNLTMSCLNRQEPEIKEILIKLYLNNETQTKIALDKGYDSTTQLMRDIKKRWVK